MTPHATSQSDSELILSQERAKYAMLGGSEVVVGASIASWTYLMNASCGAVWRSAAAPPTITPLYDSTRPQSDSKLRLSQERAKYAMLGGSGVVVGISIASTSWCTHHGAVAIRRRAPAPPPNHHTSL